MPEATALPPAIETDAVVIGGGPVGLWTVFELGLLELKAHVIDALPAVGGQCAELYPDKPIYDLPGLPCANGIELIERLQRQIAPFDAPVHLSHLVTDLAPAEGGRWRIATNQGLHLLAHSVFIAAGAGAFLPRTVKLPGLDAHVGRQVFYRREQPQHFAGQHVVVLGDGDAALEDAIDLADGEGRAASVTLVHRRDQFRARPEVLTQFQALRNAGAIRFVAGQPEALLPAQAEPGDSAKGSGDPDPGETLSALSVLPPTGEAITLPMDTLLIRLGLSPRLGPLADWGLAMERKQLPVDTAHFMTPQSGVYAVGDINTYPGKRKLLLCGFHEATLAVFAAAERQRAEPVLLQYTTTSPRLHQLLGVASS